jgi:SAM-dependent methyltransferase
VVVGLDGAPNFVEMARAHAGCEVWRQDFLHLDLPAEHFDGIFANASLFHIPAQELLRVLRELRGTLKPGGVLFMSNPRGRGEGWRGDRYGAHRELEDWRAVLDEAGFTELEHYYRPSDAPPAEQNWLAGVWRS